MCTGHLLVTSWIYADRYVPLLIIPLAHDIFYASLFVLGKMVDNPYAILKVKEFAFL